VHSSSRESFHIVDLSVPDVQFHAPTVITPKDGINSFFAILIVYFHRVYLLHVTLLTCLPAEVQRVLKVLCNTVSSSAIRYLHKTLTDARRTRVGPQSI
jgi:hypothetical protein